MRALSFRMDGQAGYGVLQGAAVRQASAAFRERYPDLRALIAAGRLAELEANLDAESIDAARVDYLPTIPNPDKILCVGVNYRPHAEEMGRELPSHPVLFVRFAGSLVGHGQPIVRPRVSGQYDYEGEVAVVIGRRTRHASRESAMDAVAGFVPFMDGSVRDWQRHTMQFTAGKNFAASGALGPCLVTRDEIPDPGAIELETRLNGCTRQRGRLSDLIFDIPALIVYCSTFAELLPGDVIATGTPAGVGAARTPPVWLSAADEVCVDVGGIGCLVNRVVNEDQ